MNTIILILIVLAVISMAAIYASFFEWVLHKYVMHGIPFGFRAAYKAHHQIHHVVFGAGKTYELCNHAPEKQEKNKKTIPMAWWHWIVLISIATLPIVLITVCFFASIWWPTLITVIVFLLYYCTYEYFHWCMHDPQGRWFEHKGWFVWANKHHNLHHRNPKTNLNVVLPLADWVLGTLRR